MGVPQKLTNNLALLFLVGGKQIGDGEINYSSWPLSMLLLLCIEIMNHWEKMQK